MRGNKTREFPLILKAITRGFTLILKARRVERGLLNCNSRVKPIQG